MSGASHADAAAAVRAALDDARAGLVEREILVELVALAAVAGEHLLVVGPPGTAKSEAARRAARAFDARYFEYALGRFTEPNELFGPIDLRRLREGMVETETSGMLPEADVAFLDEVFLGSTAILNTLLTLLNERTFRRGKTASHVPLRVCVAASNAVPDDPALAAFADRFLLHAFVEPVPDSRLEELLEAGDALGRATGATRRASLEALDVLTSTARAIDLTSVRPHVAHAVRALRRTGVALSDRRVVKLQRLVAAAAALDGRSVADRRDLWPIVYALPTADAQTGARETLRTLLDEAASGALGAAALDASGSTAARAMRLEAEARTWLADASATDTARRLRAEAILRDLDASLADETRPATLTAVRQQMIARLGEA